MKLFLKAVAAAAFAATTLGASAGLPVTNAIPSGLSLLSDNSAEQWLDVGTAAGQLAGNGKLDEGDVLRGIFAIDNTQPPITAIGIGSIYNELSGIFATRVKSRSFALTDAGADYYDYVFEADPGFAAEFAAKGAIAGTVGIFFEDTSPDFTREKCAPGGVLAGTVAQCEATAIDGSVWAVVEIASGMWKANNAAEVPSAGGFLPLSTPLGSFGFALNFQVDNTGANWAKVSCADPTNFLAPETVADMCGQGGILATGNLRTIPGSVTPYQLFDNVDLTVNRVPEPGSLALVGLALAGLGMAGRRRKA